MAILLLKDELLINTDNIAFARKANIEDCRGQFPDEAEGSIVYFSSGDEIFIPYTLDDLYRLFCHSVQGILQKLLSSRGTL